MRTRFLDAFFADFYAATVPCPVGWRTSRMFPDVPVSIILGDEKTYVTVNYLAAHPGTRATGAGTEAMRRILDLADKYGLSVYLDPVPLDEGWSWERLRKWYMSFGFVFDVEDYSMMRLPHAKGTRRPNPRRRNPAMHEYRYGARNRPPGYATVPKGFIRVDPPPFPQEARVRHGIVVYDRRLTDEEVRGYELHPYMPLAEIVDGVIASLGEYARDYADNVREESAEQVRSETSGYLDEEPKPFTDVRLADVYKHVAQELLLRFPFKQNPRKPSAAAVARERILNEVTEKITSNMQEGGWYGPREHLPRHDRPTAWDINNGHCEEWAEEASRRLGGYPVDLAALKYEMFGLPEGIFEDVAHVVLLLRGKFYDAQDPQGVSDPRQLHLVRGVPREEYVRGLRRNNANSLRGSRR
jgi:GNAT superfamily N-acetyltransferase